MPRTRGNALAAREPDRRLRGRRRAADRVSAAGRGRGRARDRPPRRRAGAGRRRPCRWASARSPRRCSRRSPAIAISRCTRCWSTRGVALVERGVVTGARKRVHRGRMDIAEAMGTRRLFDFVHDNPRGQHGVVGLHARPRRRSARLDRFVAINSALEIDLTGQVTAESLGPRQVAGIGGQFDFVLGASRSAGGRGDHRAAVDGPRRRRVADRAAAGGGGGGDHAAVPGRLGRDRARGGAAAGAVGHGEGHGADRRGPSALPGGARACAYFLAASIFAKISSSVGNRYVSWFV